jgi:flagellar biosynthesis chaperone FliJ
MQLLQQRLARLENLHAKRAEQRQFDELSARRLRRSLRPPR